MDKHGPGGWINAIRLSRRRYRSASRIWRPARDDRGGEGGGAGGDHCRDAGRSLRRSAVGVRYEPGEEGVTTPSL